MGPFSYVDWLQSCVENVLAQQIMNGGGGPVLRKPDDDDNDDDDDEDGNYDGGDESISFHLWAILAYWTTNQQVKN